jgi:hypothetical protein
VLTVKYIRECDGAEFITTANSVSFFWGYDNGPNTTEDEKNFPHVVAHGVPREEGESYTSSFSDGTVYVMNEHGKTVADYHLIYLKRKGAERKDAA